MPLSAFLYYRESHDGEMRRVLVHGEPQAAGELRSAEAHLTPKTLEGQQAEAELCRQRGWVIAHIEKLDGVRNVTWLEPDQPNVDFDIWRLPNADWEVVMRGVSDVLAHVLGQGAVTSRLDYPI